MFVMSELTTISVIGVDASFSCVRKRSANANLPFGTRYAVFIQNVASGLSSASIDVSIFIQYVAGPARHDDAQRRAVQVRQRLAVHLPREQRVLVQRLPRRDALLEIRRRGG